MASSMTKISSVTVGSGGASSIDFTSIPQTYTDLVVKISGRTTRSANQEDLRISYNGSTATFTARLLQGTGTAAASYTDTRFFGSVPSASATSTTFGNLEAYIPNYAGSTNKSASVDYVCENNATAAEEGLVASLWSTTSAITSISITGNSSGNFVQYTTATLYGVTKYAETGTGSKATGGTVTTSGGYTYHTFFLSGMFTPTASITGAEVLVVAGGGGTQGAVAGGGGAGGLIYASSQSFTSGTGYAAIVGAGGAKGVAGSQAACNGTNSSFASGTVAIGGGAGNGSIGASGSGGSGGGQAAPGSGAIGTGTAGQGNNGGANGGAYSGGGGGAGAAGGTGGANSRGGDGGNGSSTYSAWGAATSTGENYGGTYYYAGGGGGSSWNGVSATNRGGMGGLGGGGMGGGGASISVYGIAGLPNTGGGAGGDNANGLSGGSGIVIIRYTT